MKVNVQYFAQVREIAGVKEEAVEIKDSSTAMDLLKRLSEIHGERFIGYVFDPSGGTPRPYLQFLVDGEPIPPTAKLRENSTFAIIPPVGGG